LAEAMRRNERAYYLAFKLGYPSLHAIPTARNPGWSADVQNRTLIRAQRAWRAAMMKADDALWRATGVSLYFNPKQLYEHRHALRAPEYHGPVNDCIDQLKHHPAFDASGLEALRARYRNRLPVPPHMLRALFTVREWLRRYA
jgi:hypothetical protein